MADVIFWLGDASETTATVVVRSDTAGSLTLTGGTNDGPLAVDPTTEYGIVKFTVTGLSADTQYPFTILLDAVEVSSGNLRTLPASGEFNIAFGSCVGQNALHAWGFQAILDHNVKAFFALGDTPYCDEAVLSVTVDGVAMRRWSLGAAAPGPYVEWTSGRVAYDKVYDNFQRIPGWAYVTERVPTYRIADDHEYADDWDWTWDNIKNNVTGKGFVLGGNPLTSQADADTCGGYANAAFSSWAKGNPDPVAGVQAWKPSACADSAANHPSRFFTKVIGNTEFFFLDTFAHRDPWDKVDTRTKLVCVNRSENATLGYTYSDPSGAALAKTALGPHDLNALLNALLASTATFKVICSGPNPNVGNAIITAGIPPNNGWEQYQTEIDYIKAFIKRYVVGVMWLCGDAHIPSAYNHHGEDHCCINSAPLSQINYIGSSGTRFYNPGYPAGYLWRGEDDDGSTEPGAKKNAYGILKITQTYLQPSIYDENGTLLWTGYLKAGKNVLQPTLDHASGEFA